MKLLADLRSVTPQRRLTGVEALFVAERQAARLLRLAGIDNAPVPTELIADLPFVQVEHRPLSGASGSARWIKPRWVILLNSYEPSVRQRFSLAHEFKHVLDHPYASVTFGRAASATNQRAIEKVCDYFAACLLMPRPWIKAAWGTGVQDIVELAQLFEVSPQAMQVRLLQLRLLDPYLRCSGIDNAHFPVTTGLAA